MAKIKIKNSSASGSVPSGLSAGELAVNLTDKKLFIGHNDASGGIFPFLPGVSSIAAGSGISLANGKTQGDVTIINAGVTSIFGLTGIVGLTGSDGITLSVSGRTLTIQGPGAASGSGFTYYNGITFPGFGYQLKGTLLNTNDTCKFKLSTSGQNNFVNLTKTAFTHGKGLTASTLTNLLSSSSWIPTLHCTNERTKGVAVFKATTNSFMESNSSTGQLSMPYDFLGQSVSDFDTLSNGQSGDYISVIFSFQPAPGFFFQGNGGLSATLVTPTIYTDDDGVTHAVSYKEIFIDPTNIADMAGASTIDEASDGFLFYDVNATGNKLRKATFKKAVLDSADTLFTTRTSSQLLKDKSSSSVIYDVITASTISGAENGLLTGATAFKYLEANTVKSFNGNTGHVSINIVNTLNGRTGDLQGVTAIVAGSGISVSGPTGEVTISNVGVLSINGATGIIGICGGTGIEDVTTGRTLTLSLKTTGVAAGSTGYNNRVPIITVDEYGRVTGLTSIGNIEAYEVSATDTSINVDLNIGLAYPSVSYTRLYRDTLFTFNPSTNTLNLPGFTLDYNTTSKIISSSNSSGGNKNFTVSPYGDVVIRPQNANAVVGSLPVLSILNSSGLVSLTGGDLYLGLKNNGLGDVAASIIFEGDTDDGSETTLTIEDPTADRTITLPNDSGTVALTKNVVTSINGSTGSISVPASAFTKVAVGACAAGTFTGDPLIFATGTADTFSLYAGAGILLTGSSANDSVIVTNTNANSFLTMAFSATGGSVVGIPAIQADISSDTLIIQAGNGIKIDVEDTVDRYSIFNDGVLSFNGSTGAIVGVSSVNGSTGAITNVARTNEGNTFSVRQVLNAGFTSAGGTFTKGITFSPIVGNSIVFDDTTESGVTLLHTSPFVAAASKFFTIISEEQNAFLPDPASIKIAGGDSDNVLGSITLDASDIYSTGTFVTPFLSSPSIFGHITLPLSETIRNTTDGSIDLMPSGSCANHYGMRVDTTSWGYGTKLYSVRGSDNNLTAGSFLFMNACVVNNDVDFSFNSSNSSRIRHTTSGNDTLQVIVTNDANHSGAVAIINQQGIGTVGRSPGITHANPNLYVYSADYTDANDFIRFEHNQTNANIVSGTGGIDLQPQNSVVSIMGGLSAAGSATKAQIQLSGNTLISTPVGGALEYDGTVLYASTPSGRGLLPSTIISAATSDVSLSNVNTAQSVFTGAADTISLRANTTYLVKGQYIIQSGTTTHTTAVGFLYGGGVTASMTFSVLNVASAVGTVARAQDMVHFDSISGGVINSTSPSARNTIIIDGMVETDATTGCTLTPQITFSAAPGGTNLTKFGSYISFTPIGNATMTSIGPWS